MGEEKEELVKSHCCVQDKYTEAKERKMSHVVDVHSFCRGLLASFDHSPDSIDLVFQRSPGTYFQREVIRRTGDGEFLVVHQEVQISLNRLDWMVLRIHVRRLKSSELGCSETIVEQGQCSVSAP